MSGSDLQGRWTPSSVTEEDVSKLREARYLTSEIPHRLPAQGHVIPSPQPGESVVFISHFLRGLGFPMALCTGVDVLLWARVPRPSSGVHPPHLLIHSCVRSV